MKYTTITTLTALLLASVSASAQQPEEAFSKPSGFVTHALKAGQFNLIGLTLHEPIAVSGAFEGGVSNDNGTPGAGPVEISDDYSVMTDDQINFDSSLISGKAYILEIIEASNPALVGTIQEVSQWTGSTITTGNDIVSSGIVGGDKYQIRATATLASVFGAQNTSGLLGGDSSALSDNIYIQTDQGFDVYYYSTGGFFGVGWRKVGASSADVSNQELFLTDGFYIFRTANTDLDIVLTGSVKVVNTDLAITKKYTIVSGVFPVGSTLSSSKLKDTINGGDSSALADNILVQNSAGGFDYYYYSTGGFFGVGWRKVGDSSIDHANTDLPSAFIVSRVGNENFNLRLNKPDGYEGL